MTAALATIEGHTITRARVTAGAYGLWWADLNLQEEIALSGAVVIRLGDIEAHGAIVAGGAIHGRAAYRVVGGAGGWGRDIKARGYANDLGVKASKVLADAARDAGETIDTAAATVTLGPHYARRAEPAHLVLHTLVPENWYVGFDGVTRIGQRPATTLSSDAPRTRVDRLRGVIELATEEISRIVPGVSIDGSPPASDVEYELSDSRLTARVYYKAQRNRRVSAMSKIIAALTADLRYAGVWEYRVVSQSGERLNLQVARVASGMSDLINVPVRPGISGGRADVASGEMVLVVFADRDPSRPNVISHDAADAPGWMPELIELGGPVTLAVAREMDPVTAGAFAGAINPRPGAKVKSV